MAFYDLSKEDRAAAMSTIQREMETELKQGGFSACHSYAADEDTYIRKAVYLSAGRIYIANPDLRETLVAALQIWLEDVGPKVRQTAVNSAGEIAKNDFEKVRYFFDAGLKDPHHSVRNAVIGSVKKAGEVNPGPLLDWAKGYLKHEDPEIRREICHGIELRGRKHPGDILPLLKVLEWDKKARVYKTLVHVIGQISYKKGCLEKVIEHLKQWENKKLVEAALEEIIDVHDRYRNFAFYSQEDAGRYIEEHW